MYTKELTTRITVRLDPIQLEFIESMAAVMDMTPSQYIRQTIDIARFGYYNTLPLDVPADVEEVDPYVNS